MYLILSPWGHVVSKNNVTKRESTIPIQTMERGHTNGHMVGSIVAILPQVQPLHLHLLFPYHLVPQILLHPLVDYLGLSIPLRVVAGTRIERGAHQSKKLLPKCPHEVVVIVTNYGLGKTMQREDLSIEQLRNLRSRVLNGDNKEMGILHQPTHHYICAIMTLNNGKFCDEFHRDAFLFPFQNGERL